MCKFNKGAWLNYSWNCLRVCIIIASFICLTQVNAVSSSTTCNTSSDCSLREWLVTLKDEAFVLECTLTKLEKSTTLLSKVNYATTSMRLNQITKLKKTISNLKGEIEIISSTCSTFYGPDCNLTTPECNSKCLNCTSPGICSNCTGNWNGTTCSLCKSGWNGTDCNIPTCDSKCLNCTSPGICTSCSGKWDGPTCSNCTGNWNGISCSVCKTGWTGSDCNTPICGSNCASCASPNVCPTCKTGWIGTDCNTSSSKLLFKASRDGFSASAFHSKCDNKGPTIVIVKSTFGGIFGGYTSVSWKSSGGYATDNTAFLFSLVSSLRVERFTKLTYQNGDSYKNMHYLSNTDAIYNEFNYGPAFGFGYDIYIADNSNSNTNSYTNPCRTYCDTTMTYFTDTAKEYFTGSYKFQVEDYEVYSL